MNFVTITSLIGLGIGAVMFLIVMIVIASVTKDNMHKEKLLKNGVTAIATCVEYKESTDVDEVVLYEPVFEINYLGQNVRIDGGLPDTEKPYRIGEQVQLKINPNDPKDFAIVEEKNTTY